VTGICRSGKFSSYIGIFWPLESRHRCLIPNPNHNPNPTLKPTTKPNLYPKTNPKPNSQNTLKKTLKT